MPTGCREADFAKIAKAAGYVCGKKFDTMESLATISELIACEKGPALLEIAVSLYSRQDLGRPKESARENKESFMRFLNSADLT